MSANAESTLPPPAPAPVRVEPLFTPSRSDVIDDIRCESRAFPCIPNPHDD